MIAALIAVYVVVNRKKTGDERSEGDVEQTSLSIKRTSNVPINTAHETEMLSPRIIKAQSSTSFIDE